MAGGVGYGVWRARVNEQAREQLAAAVTIARAPVTPAPDAASGSKTPPVPGSYQSERAKLEAALPKFLEAADRYPSTPAAITARYHAAGILASLGKPAEAIERSRQVQQRDPRGLYGRMARLGEADAHMLAGDTIRRSRSTRS